MAEQQAYECDGCGTTEVGSEPHETIPDWVYARIQVRTFRYGEGSQNDTVHAHYCPDCNDLAQEAAAEAGATLNEHLTRLEPDPEPEPEPEPDSSDGEANGDEGAIAENEPDAQDASDEQGDGSEGEGDVPADPGSRAW